MTDLEMTGPSFEGVFRDNFDLIAGYADGRGARLLGQGGEDVAQETMLRAWRNEINPGNPKPWLYKVAGRIVIDNHRRVHNKHELSTDPEVMGQVDLVDGTDHTASARHSAVVEDALSLMSDVQREVVELTFLKGYTINEAAEILEIPSGTVRSRRYYGIRAARAAFKGMGLGAEDVLG